MLKIDFGHVILFSTRGESRKGKSYLENSIGFFIPRVKYVFIH